MGYAFQAKDNLVHLKFMGDFSEADLQAYLQDFMPYLERATAENRLNFLLDVHQLGKLCSQARKQFTQLNGNPHVGKVGILGFNPFIKVLATFILKASSRDNIRFFAKEEEALTWFQEDTQQS